MIPLRTAGDQHRPYPPRPRGGDVFRAAWPGVFHVDGTTIEASTGDSVVVPEGSLLDYENPGPDRVYLLTVVSTDDGFAEGLRHGIPTPLDAEDLAVLRSL